MIKTFSPLIKLELRSSITYVKIDITPEKKEKTGKDEEILLCYELNPAQGRNIEPDREQFLGNLLFIGEKTSQKSGTDTGQTACQEVLLPLGTYIFVQCRENAPLGREKWLDMAIEQQKDGLWERHKLENLIYVRYLHEDGAFVTQLFRPCITLDV